jgi:hypothetical protein
VKKGLTTTKEDRTANNGVAPSPAEDTGRPQLTQ